MKTFRYSILFLIARASILYAAQPLDPPPQAAGYKLAFHDEFDKLSLSPNGLGDSSWFVNVWFNHKPAPVDNVSVSNSILSLVWKDSQPSPDTSITGMSHDGRHVKDWRYGYFEARFRWDVETGAWPAFWLIPVEGGNYLTKSAQETGEIDVFLSVRAAARMVVVLAMPITRMPARSTSATVLAPDAAVAMKVLSITT